MTLRNLREEGLFLSWGGVGGGGGRIASYSVAVRNQQLAAGYTMGIGS